MEPSKRTREREQMKRKQLQMMTLLKFLANRRHALSSLRDNGIKCANSKTSLKVVPRYSGVGQLSCTCTIQCSIKTLAVHCGAMNYCLAGRIFFILVSYVMHVDAQNMRLISSKLMFP